MLGVLGLGKLVEVAVALPDWAARVLEEAAEELGVDVGELLRAALEELVGARRPGSAHHPRGCGGLAAFNPRHCPSN